MLSLCACVCLSVYRLWTGFRVRIRLRFVGNVRRMYYVYKCPHERRMTFCVCVLTHWISFSSARQSCMKSTVACWVFIVIIINFIREKGASYSSAQKFAYHLEKDTKRHLLYYILLVSICWLNFKFGLFSAVHKCFEITTLCQPLQYLNPVVLKPL